MSQTIVFVGTVATEPRLFQKEDRIPFCTFRVASNERRFDRDTQNWVDGETNWFTVHAFRSLATHAHASFTKGDRVLVTGKLRIRRWEANEKSGVSVEVEADAIGHDVRWGTSVFTKDSGQQESDSTAVSPAIATDSLTEPRPHGFHFLPDITHDASGFTPENTRNDGSPAVTETADAPSTAAARAAA